MPLRLHDTMRGAVVPFEPADPTHVRVYVCGPTPYDHAHLGHVRCYVVYDVLVRHLRAHYPRVTYVRNVTDIDDKIVARARARGIEPLRLAAEYYEAFRQDMARVGNLPPDLEPRVSDHLADIERIVQGLVERGHAYVVDGDVYFDVTSYPAYGRLSGRRLQDLVAGASGRIDDAEAARKRHPADFALWKAATDGEPGWPSRWGRGRPGWHIECSAMSLAHLGAEFDLHGGGLDLVFPHHENEIAQTECYTGRPCARHWVHNGFVEVQREKMSKSLGNFFTARELFERVEPEAIRWLVLGQHYRSPLQFDGTVDDEGRVTGFPQLEEAERRVEYLYETRARLQSIGAERQSDGGTVPDPIAAYGSRLDAALDDDLHLPQALAVTNELLAAVNELCDRSRARKATVPAAAVRAARDALGLLGSRLGLGTNEPTALLASIRARRARLRGIDVALVERYMAERDAARAARDFARADAVRGQLQALGVEVLDGPDGSRWRVA
ncbi:MAG: cysteine--tRNA ligase [Myxococcales bacterium]|nr:cysteine--tRNA ligase [Myxococcales bacterium]